MVGTELPSTYFTVEPVAFSNAVAWHFFELSTKVPPKVATISSSAWAGKAGAKVSRHSSRVSRETIMVGAPPGACGGAIIRQPRRASQPDLLEPTYSESMGRHA